MIDVMAKRRNLPGPVTYFVVARDEDTGELLDYQNFTSYREAQRFLIGYAERADPPGRITKTTIESVPTGQWPENKP
jgi:hypothetical protein